MQHCRSLTLKQFEGLDSEAFRCQVHPDFSPIGWHLGHIAYTEALWLLQRCAGCPPLFSEYHRLFAQDGLPKADRVNLPNFDQVCDYLNAIRSKVFEYLEVAPLDQQERLWRWLLQHESQHAETIALVLALQQQQKSKPQNPPACLNAKSQPASEMVCVAAGEFEQGNESLDALDNERPVHRVYLETYWIDRTPVTCGQFRSFIQVGGYQTSRWWSLEGWQWLQAYRVTEPLYWPQDASAEDHPVCGVSWYEAEAYARFVGKRLPTEAEWEKAASWNPVTQQRSRHPWGDPELDATRCNHSHLVGKTSPSDRQSRSQSFYGCIDLLGNVWEWTQSWFDGYPGFESYPYPGYSQAYFDGAHRVLKGGSWATHPWALRSTFRNWYYPSVREILAGFRCASDAKL